MSFYNGILNHEDNHEQGQIGPRGLPGIGYKVDANGNFDIENKKLTNVQNGDMDHDVMVKSQIEGYVSTKTQYLDGALPAKVSNNKAVIYSPSGGVHSNDLYLKDQYGQEVHFFTEDQDDNQIRLHIPNLKNYDGYGDRRKSSVVVTSIDQTIQGKKVFHDIEVPRPSSDMQACNKKYTDDKIKASVIDGSNFVSKAGDTMRGELILPKYTFPIQGSLDKAISYETIREIFLSRKETRPMEQSLDMGNHIIENLKSPTDVDNACNKGYVDNLVNSKADTSDLDEYLKLDGTKAMTGNINMNNNRILRLPDPQLADEPVTRKFLAHTNTLFYNVFLDLDGNAQMRGNIKMNDKRITGLTNPPNADDEATNKQYVDDNISKANIKPSHTPKNVFQYLMNDVNEWST